MSRNGLRRVAQLEREVESLRLRAAINRILGRDVSAWVNNDDSHLDLILEDVAQQWLARKDSDPPVLDGPYGFWSRYANHVEWAPPESGNEYRAEFCPAREDDPFDTDDYFRSVWAAHVAELRALTEGPETMA
ncbi:MAG TPA: hypothetical protein VGJ07_27960 [Rugosimonospora sp.]